MNWRIALVAGFTVLSGVSLPSPAQDFVARKANADGFHLYNVSSYTGYASLGLPNANYNYLLGSVPVGPDFQWGGAVRAGLLRSRPASSLSLIYDGAYNGLARHSEWNAASHKMTFDVKLDIPRKWEFRAGLNASATSLYQFLFAPSSLSSAARIPNSFDQLAGAMLSGRFTNEQLASILTGAPGLETPGRTALFGSRVLSGSANTSISYTHSRRFILRFSGVATHSQHLNRPDVPNTLTTQPLLPRTTSASATAGFTYSPTLRTDLGVDATATRVRSDLQDAYTTKVLGSIGRRLGRRWFLKGHAGPAWITPVRQFYTLPAYALPTGIQYGAGGSVGFGTSTQSLLAAVDRTPSDSYGTGAQHTLSSTAAWSWRRRGSAWTLSASARQQQLRGTAQELDSWMMTGGISRALSAHTTVEIAYTYLNNSGTYLGTRYDMVINAVQLSFQWRESGQAR